MGRSSDNHQQNPATRFYQWGGGDGTLSYYDGETNVDVPFSESEPFKFLIVEKGCQVTGGVTRDKQYTGFWSNFVLNTTMPFTVRSKDGIEARGLWSDIKGTNGVKFATSLYIGVPTQNGLELQHIKFSGAALNAWIEASKGKDIFKGAFAITGSVKEKNGSITYHVPVFKYYPEVSETADSQAKQLDKDLQAYLDAYFQNGHAEKEEKAHSVAAGAESYLDSEPEFPEQTAEELEIPF